MQEILAASYHSIPITVTLQLVSYIAMHTNIATAWLSAMGYLIQCAWNNGAVQLPHIHTCMGGYDNYTQLAIASQYVRVLMLFGDHTIIKLCTILGSYSYKPIRTVAECGLVNQCTCDNQQSIITIISAAQPDISKRDFQWQNEHKAEVRGTASMQILKNLIHTYMYTLQLIDQTLTAAIIMSHSVKISMSNKWTYIASQLCTAFIKLQISK